MNVKVELARQDRDCDVGDTWQGYPIVATVPGSPQVILQLPDSYDAGIADLLVRDWIARGLIVDDGRGLWRPEHTDYTVLWLPDRLGALAAVEVGDTFGMCGIAPATQERGRYGAGVLMLHLDTGCDVNHSAFAGKSIARADPDSHGHGTHTASTAASAWGVAPDAVLYSVNVLPGGTGSEAQIANGIRQAADYAVQQRTPAVMTMSLGGSGSSVMDDACAYARARGVVVESAAGNTPGAVIGSPARASDLIVLACDRARNYALFTSGIGWSNPNRVTLPGVDIAAAARGTGDGVLVASGTSMATPHCAGQVALLLAGGA